MARPRRSRSTASDPGAVPGAGPAEALSAALRYLARAPRSRAEVARHLEGLGVAPELTIATLDTLAERRYVDDLALAERRA